MAKKADTRSFTITLPGMVVDLLDRLAAHQGRTRGNLVAFLVESIIRRKYPDEFPNESLEIDESPDE